MNQSIEPQEENQSSYSFCFRRYWCQICRREYRLHFNATEETERYCENCESALEIVPHVISDHPRNFDTNPRLFNINREQQLQGESSPYQLFFTNNPNYQFDTILRSINPTIIIFFGQNSQPQGVQPAKQEKIQQLEKVIYKESQNQSVCYICQEVYNEGDSLINLTCQHSYHEDCVTKWLNLRNSCPCCRAQI